MWSFIIAKGESNNNLLLFTQYRFFPISEFGRHSPATEDEAFSEFDADSAPSKKQEYSLPQPKCKIYYTKVKKSVFDTMPTSFE